MSHTSETLIDPRSAKAYAQAPRSWYQKKRYWAGSLVVVLILVSVATGGETNTTQDATTSTTSSTSAADESDRSAEVAMEGTSSEPELTASQQNALKAAENYLAVMPFSRKGLIQQLSSDAGDGYLAADAIFAVDNVEVNWWEQAAKAARDYLDTRPFSRAALIRQLSSDAGDGYTKEQAIYGADSALGTHAVQPTGTKDLPAPW